MNKEDNNINKEDSKEVTYYHALYYGVLAKSWMNSSLIHDVSILISSLVFLIVFTFLPSSIEIIESPNYDMIKLCILFGIVLSSQSLIVCTIIFKKNLKYIEDLIHDKEPKSLKAYDIYNMLSFTLSILILIIIYFLYLAG